MRKTVLAFVVTGLMTAGWAEAANARKSYNTARNDKRKLYRKYNRLEVKKSKDYQKLHEEEKKAVVEYNKFLASSSGLDKIIKTYNDAKKDKENWKKNRKKISSEYRQNRRNELKKLRKDKKWAGKEALLLKQKAAVIAKKEKYLMSKFADFKKVCDAETKAQAAFKASRSKGKQKK